MKKRMLSLLVAAGMAASLTATPVLADDGAYGTISQIHLLQTHVSALQVLHRLTELFPFLMQTAKMTSIHRKTT